MKSLLMSAGCLLLVWTSACKCSPPITAQKIQADIVGKSISIAGYGAGAPDTRIFQEVSETKISVAESSCQSNQATITVDIETRASRGIALAMASGRLRVSYERVGNEWVLRKLENETF